MKRAFKIGLLAVLAAVLCVACTGCIKLNETISINADKSMDFVIDEGVNVEKYLVYSGATSEQTTVDQLAEEITGSVDASQYPDWKVETYRDGAYAGAKMTYHVDNIDDVSITTGSLAEWQGLSLGSTYATATDATTSMSDMSDVVFFYYDEKAKTYTLKIASGLDPSSDSYSSASSMMSAMFDELSVTVNLPYPALSSNATQTSNGGKTLTWSYTPDTFDKMGSLEVSFALDGDRVTSSALLIGLGIVLVVAIVAATIVVRSNRKKREAACANAAEGSAQ